MEIIVKSDEVHRWLGFDLVNHDGNPFGVFIFGIFHVFAYQTSVSFRSTSFLCPLFIPQDTTFLQTTFL